MRPWKNWKEFRSPSGIMIFHSVPLFPHWLTGEGWGLTVESFGVCCLTLRFWLWWEEAEGLAWGLGTDLITFLQDVNDHTPECEPPFQELTIHPHPGRSMEVTKVSCRVPQEPQRLAFSYSIVGGEGHEGNQALGKGQAKVSNGPLLL